MQAHSTNTHAQARAHVEENKETKEAIAPVDATLLEQNARLLAAAFEVDPAYRYLFPNAKTRAAGLTDFFTGNQRMHLPHRCTHVARDAQGTLCGTVTLRPPGGIHMPAIKLLRYMLPFRLRRGGEAVRRLLWLKHTYDALEAQAAEHAPHFYVHMMAVRPDVQGRGVGTRLLERVLDQGLRAHPDTRIVLTTHLPVNLVFYRRMRFEVTDERVLQPPGGAPYTVWSMARDS